MMQASARAARAVAVRARCAPPQHARCASAQAGAVSPATVLASDLTCRALLRNLRLLKGMRPKERFDVIVTGYEAAPVAERLAALEPVLRLTVSGDSRSADFSDVRKRQGDVDSVIVLQPYHVLHERSELADVKACLDEEEGTLGFLWTRAGTLGWLEAFNRAAAAHLGPGGLDPSAAARGIKLPSLGASGPDASPMSWFDDLNVTDLGFRALKHRKFVERFEGPPQAYADVLPCIHDARFALDAARTSPAFQAGMAAAVEAAAAQAAEAAAAAGSADEAELGFRRGQQGPVLPVDLHSFHTSVVPPVVSKKKK